MQDLPVSGWRNKGGTSKRPTCKCGSWKKHWENFTKKPWPEKCSREGCDEMAEDGAHIYNSDNAGTSIGAGYAYGIVEIIVPLCKACNHIPNQEPFKLKQGTFYAPASREHTCGY